MGSWVSYLFSLWPRWLTFHTDADTDDSHHQYIKTVVAAVDQGDIDKLKELHESPGLRTFGGIENISVFPSLIHRAAAKEYDTIVRYLIQLGVSVEHADSCEMTALHEACKKKNLKCVLELVNHSKNIDKKDVWGRTPLMKALVYRNQKAAELLLSRGANPNATDNYGMTPLSTVIDYNMLDMLRLLVNHGADINMVTVHQLKCSGPPLYQAVINQNNDIVNELINLGAVTQPRPQDFCDLSSDTGMRYRGGHKGLLQHDNVVMLAMAEMVKRNAIDTSGPGMDILMALLAAHGYSLGSSPDVIIRVLINSRPQDFSMLLQKLQICSSSSQDELLTSSRNRDAGQRHAQRPQHLQQIDHHLGGSNGARKSGHQVMTLENQARRVARQAVMCSGHNVVWATHRLQCPPALKSLLLLKDIDRAFYGAVHKNA